MKTLLFTCTIALAALIGCSQPVNLRVATRLNDGAHLTGELPSNPMQGQVITSWIERHEQQDQQTNSMSTMFGNSTAAAFAKSGGSGGYPAGSVISVVTWNQQEDPRWFGGKIPAAPKQVEFVTVTGPDAFSYTRYTGAPLQKVTTVDDADAKTRGEYLLGVHAAVMP